MERNARVSFGRQGVISAVVIILGWFSAPTYCGRPGTALLLKISPAQGGIITPPAGLYRFEMGSKVILTAAPKTGYRFVTWLGDVVDPIASNTFTFLDEPKIIVAVFERTGEIVAGGGSGGPMRTVSEGLVENNRMLFLTRFPQDEPIIPEPATGILLVLGGLSLLGKRKA